MADASVICIRCGSRAHTTRDHDEGKIGPQSGGAAAKKKGAAKKNDVGPSSGVKNLYMKHDHCWQRPSSNPGIPDVIEPPFRMQPYDDPCIASWHDRNSCLCKDCEKRRKKIAFVEAQRKRRIADRGKLG